MPEIKIVDLEDGRDAFRELAQGDPEWSWLVDKADRPAAGGRIALAGDHAIGVVMWSSIPGFDGVEQFYLAAFTPTEHQDPAWEQRLWDHFDQPFAGRRCTVWFHIHKHTRRLAGIVETLGMEHVFTTLEYGKALPLPELEPCADAELVRFTGRDAAVEAEISDLHRRGFTGRSGVPDLVFRDDYGQIEPRWILAYEDRQLVGLLNWVAFNGEAVCDSIVVARSHYGTGLAHTLGRAFSDDAFGEGLEKATCHVHETNHASRKLVERFGLTVEDDVGAYRREFHP